MTSNPTTVKPTKILAEPYKKHDKGVVTWMILTDTGLFTAGALSKILGLAPNGMTNRLSRLSWDDPETLADPQQGVRLGGKPVEHYDDFGNAAWRALGSAPRNARLQTLTAPCYAETTYPTVEEEWDQRAKAWAEKYGQ